MEKVKLDKRGRVTLPQDIREKIKAREFMIVRAGHTVVLHPISKEPLKHWQEAWRGVSFQSLKKEKEETRAAIRKELSGE